MFSSPSYTQYFVILMSSTYPMLMVVDKLYVTTYALSFIV